MVRIEMHWIIEVSVHAFTLCESLAKYGEIRNRFCSKLKTKGVNECAAVVKRYKLNLIDKSVDFMKHKKRFMWLILKQKS